MRFEWASITFAHATYGFQYFEGQFYAMADNGAGTFYLARSTNMVDWTYHTLPSMTNAGYVAYNGSTYVVTGVASAAHKVWTSTDDGSTWTARVLPSAPAFSTNYSMVCWHPVRGEFLFMVVTGSYTARSPTGVTWTNLASNLPSQTRIRLFPIDARYVTCEAGGAGETHYSSNGENWVESAAQPFSDLVPMQGQLWSAGQSAAIARRTYDGLNWIGVTDQGQYTYALSIDDDTVFAFIGDAYYSGLSSVDQGLNWTDFELPEPVGVFYDAVWFGGKLYLDSYNSGYTTLYIGTPIAFWAGHANTLESN